MSQQTPQTSVTKASAPNQADLIVLEHQGQLLSFKANGLGFEKKKTFHPCDDVSDIASIVGAFYTLLVLIGQWLWRRVN